MKSSAPARSLQRSAAAINDTLDQLEQFNQDVRLVITPGERTARDDRDLRWKPKRVVTQANNSSGLLTSIRGCASWQDIQRKWRRLSEQQKGALFEQLVKAYLLLEPEYASKLKPVWLLREVPQTDKLIAELCVAPDCYSLSRSASANSGATRRRGPG